MSRKDFKKIFMPSIMHTGTTFCERWLFGAGPISLLRLHTDHRRLEAIIGELEQIDKYDAVVVPLRHPARVLRSFMKRGRTWESYVEQWNEMMVFIAPLNPHYIHIDDLEIRDAQRHALEEMLDFKIVKKGWPKVNSRSDSSTYPIEKVQNVPQKYVDFYNDTKYSDPNKRHR